MTDCFPSPICLPSFKGRKVEINFEGGDVTSDGGIVLLQQIDQKLGLTEKVAGRLWGQRDPSRVKHDQLSMIRQRIYGLALGYEDLNVIIGFVMIRCFKQPFIKKITLPVVPRCAGLKTRQIVLLRLPFMKFFWNNLLRRILIPQRH